MGLTDQKKPLPFDEKSLFFLNAWLLSTNPLPLPPSTPPFHCSYMFPVTHLSLHTCDDTLPFTHRTPPPTFDSRRPRFPHPTPFPRCVLHLPPLSLFLSICLVIVMQQRNIIMRWSRPAVDYSVTVPRLGAPSRVPSRGHRCIARVGKP